MDRSELVCYGCIRNVDISHQDGVYRLEKSTIRILEPLLSMKQLEFGLTVSDPNDFRLNIYGPQDNKLVGRRLEDSKVSLQDPSTIRPGLSYKNAQRTHYARFMLDHRVIVHNLWDSAPEMNDVQSWSVAEVRRMRKDARRVSSHFHYFKRLPAEIRCMITAQLTAHEMFNFLRSHKGAQNDVINTHGRSKAIWDRWFVGYSWLDKMVRRGFQPALIGTPYRSKDHKKTHLALVLIGQNKTMDWTQDSKELIQTLRCQEGNSYAAIMEHESLHIGQPFGKTELQRHPNLSDSLRGSAFHTNRQLSALKRRGKTVEEWNAQTFILYYEPLKPEPHPGTGLHVTTAVIQTFSSSFQVWDAKQPEISWHFGEPELAINDPLLPEGLVKTHSGYLFQEI